MNLKTEKGNIQTKAVYAERAFVQTTKGGVLLGNLHADCKVTTVSGNIHANGLTGSLTADTEKGNVDVQASQPKMIHIISKEGNVDVKLAGNIEPILDLVGENVSVDPGFVEPTGNIHNGTVTEVIVRCPRGKISITRQDWVSSLNLKA